MNYVDTHCHIDYILEKMKLSSYTELKESFFPSNFEKCISIACEESSIAPLLKLMEHSEMYGAFGIHPHDAKTYDNGTERQLEDCMKHSKCVAWGEIGLDYFYNHSDPVLQKKVFIRQIEKGIEHKKPLVIHTREAEEDTLAIMLKHIPKHWNIHVHCFTSSTELAESLLENFDNLYIGFTGIVTFKNAEGVRATVEKVPLNKLVLETDSPFLAPAPHRGKVAHPGHIPHIAEKIAELKKVNLEEVYSQARINTTALYGI